MPTSQEKKPGLKEEMNDKEYIQNQFTKIVEVLRVAGDYTQRDEDILSIVAKFTGLELPEK